MPVEYDKAILNSYLKDELTNLTDTQNMILR